VQVTTESGVGTTEKLPKGRREDRKGVLYQEISCQSYLMIGLSNRVHVISDLLLTGHPSASFGGLGLQFIYVGQANYP